MKKRLLMLLSLFMAVTSVGWVHAQSATVSTVEGLQEAIAAEKSPIKLSATTFELSEQLVINKPITIQGTTGTIIIAKDGNWPGDNSKKNLISIEGQETGTVTLQNLCIKGSKASGINAQSKMKTILTNVTLEGNTNAGLLVHSEVDAKGLVTKLNVWGGVNVDKGTPGYTPSFTFDAASTFEEKSKIWSELEDSESVVKAPIGWRSYLGVQGTSTKKMRYWITSKLTQEDNIIFANGYPITIKKANQTDEVIVCLTDNESDFIQLKSSDAVVYGGAKNKTVDNSTITMESGVVKSLFGGGLGDLTEKKQAAVTGKTAITIKGGNVTNILVGGGKFYAKSNEVEIKISGKDTKIATLYAGGYDAGQTSNKLETSLDNNVNGVQKFTLTMTDGTITKGIGCGGGQGYSYTGKSNVSLTNVKIASFYGVLANGRANDIVATLNNCTFYKEGVSYREIGAINRGQIKDASFSFNNCFFDDPTNIETVTVSLGAIEGWGNSDTNGDPVPSVTGSVAFTFTGCENTPDMVIGEGLENANVTLTGAKAVLKYYHRGSGIVAAKGEKYMDAFKIADSKTWTFNNGFEINQPEESVSATVTLDNKGTLNVPAASIMSAIEAGGALAVDTTSTAVVAKMNEAVSKSDLSGKTFSIECKDGVIASNETVAKELLKEGKVVKKLSYDFSNTKYLITSYQKTLAKITNLPDSVVYGTEPITLAFNLKNTTATISTESDVAEITNGVLTIKKPGTVTFNLTVDGNDDATNTQTLKVTKRTISLLSGIKAVYSAAKNIAYSGDTAIIYNGNKDIVLAWDKSNIEISGLPWDATHSSYFKETSLTGERTNENVGSKVPVNVTNDLDALLVDSAKECYTLAPITFVTANVIKAKATVTANNEEYVFGSELPVFKAKTTGVVDGDALDGTLKFICSATPDSLVKEGGYDIMPYGQTSDNYAIEYKGGTLTVKPTEPKIEIVDAKVDGNSDSKNITVRANLIHSGGAVKAATVTATATSTSVSASQASNDNEISKGEDGNYTYTIINATAGKYTITFSATSSEKTGTASIDVTVEGGVPQNLTFDDKVLSSIVYGDSLPLIVTSDQKAAIGNYTFKVSGEEATISATNVLTPKKVGDVTVTVSRAADKTYSSATVTKTIKVTPRPLKASVGMITKVYDGTVTVNPMPEIKLSDDYKVIGNDKVSIASGATATYASKNVGNHAITLSTLELEGGQAKNYTLIQPTDLKGEITKKRASVKVDDVTRMYNQRYTKYTFTTQGLVNGESLSSVYTGKLDVTENGDKLLLTINSELCLNYELEAINGKLTIDKGTPVVVAYTTNSQPNALIVDSAGYEDLTAEYDSKDGYYIVKAGGQTITNSVNAILTIPTIIAANRTMLPSVLTKADELWNNEEPISIAYGSTVDGITLSGYSFSSTDMNRLSVDDNGNLKVTGVGRVAIIATKGTDVKVRLYEVTPKEVTYTADMSKTYDGSTLAAGNVKLGGVENGDNVVLDVENVTFNYKSQAAGTEIINPSQSPILTGTHANNYTLKADLKGEITRKEITVSTPISAYYTGKEEMTLGDFTAEGILSNDVVSLKVKLNDSSVGSRKFTLLELTKEDAGNYTLSNSNAELEGTILKPTIVVEVPETASGVDDAKNKLTYTIRETGKSVSGSVFSDAVKVVSLGNDTYQVSTGVENSNFSLVYTKNLIGYKANTTPPDGGGDVEQTVTIALNASSKVLPRTEEFELTATVSPAGKTVTWSSSDPTIATVTANGNKATVKGIKVGKATITAKIGDVTATCLVTVDFATGIEEMLAQTEVYSQPGNIIVNPVQPLQLTIVNMTGQTVYNDYISGSTQIPARSGVYIVKLSNAGNTIISKLIVR